MTCHSLSIILFSIGLYAVFKFHNDNKIPNLYSLHSWVGLGAVICYCTLYVGSFFAFMLNVVDEDVKRHLIVWHISVGHGTFALAFLAMLTGYLEKLTFMNC